jgi:hypothetical protein
MKSVKVAILGACGWMGKCHSLGYRNLPLLYPEFNIEAELCWLVDEDEAKLKAIGPAYRGARASTRWQDAVDDPAVDLVDICLPDHLHYQRPPSSAASTSIARSRLLLLRVKRRNLQGSPIARSSSAVSDTISRRTRCMS